jgi:hypothetical protein
VVCRGRSLMILFSLVLHGGVAGYGGCGGCRGHDLIKLWFLVPTRRVSRPSGGAVDAMALG